MILYKIPEGAILVTAVVGLYPSIAKQTGLESLKKTLDERENKLISRENIVKMTEFALKNNYFQFIGKVKQQISGIAIEAKFAPTYTCVFMDLVETDFRRAQEKVPLVWFRYDDVFYMDSWRK